jgi:hypothetical protein
LQGGASPFVPAIFAKHPSDSHARAVQYEEEGWERHECVRKDRGRDMSRHYISTETLSPMSAVLLTLALVYGCGDQSSPASPTGTASDLRSAPVMVSGHVYQQASGIGEPAVADALITLKDARGAESTAVSDHRGFYCVEATPGEVVITATKEGFNRRESRFDIARSTVLNFGLEPMLP